MYIELCDLINISIFVYLDDVNVFSNNRCDHLQHLKNIFKRCRKYGISLNPPTKVYLQSLRETIRFFFISKNGIMIEIDQTKIITKLSLPHNKKSNDQEGCDF